MTSQDATISASMLSDVPKRASLGPIMGGSAAKLSGIGNSEWLHLVAHSLGGPDTPVNIVAGAHSLNTAMIPFEYAVRMAVMNGNAVDYNVTFFSDQRGKVMYVHHVQIQIILASGKKGIWTLEVNRKKPFEFINGQVLAEIKACASGFFK